MVTAATPLWRRFPAAHQFFRMKLIDEIFPIPSGVSCWAEPSENDHWLVTFRWPAIDFEASEQFAAGELREVYGRWAHWARGCAFDIADRLPV